MRVKFTGENDPIWGYADLCDAYIDQGRYIGDDPVGYKCIQPSTEKFGAFNVCAACAQMIRNEPTRVSFLHGKIIRVQTGVDTTDPNSNGRL